MGHVVQAAGSGYRQIALPNGVLLAPGQSATISNADFAKIPSAWIGTLILNVNSAAPDPGSAPVLVLGLSDVVPAGTAPGTVIVRRTS